MQVRTYEKACECIVDSINAVKSTYENPLIVLGGDFNLRSPDGIIESFPDILQLDTPPTRKWVCLDLISSNIQPNKVTIEKRPPLRTEDGRHSDHDSLYVRMSVEKKCRVKWNKYKSRKRTAK